MSLPLWHSSIHFPASNLRARPCWSANNPVPADNTEWKLAGHRQGMLDLVMMICKVAWNEFELTAVNYDFQTPRLCISWPGRQKAYAETEICSWALSFAIFKKIHRMRIGADERLTISLDFLQKAQHWVASFTKSMKYAKLSCQSHSNNCEGLYSSQRDTMKIILRHWSDNLCRDTVDWSVYTERWAEL